MGAGVDSLPSFFLRMAALVDNIPAVRSQYFNNQRRHEGCVSAHMPHFFLLFLFAYPIFYIIRRGDGLQNVFPFSVQRFFLFSFFFGILLPVVLGVFNLFFSFWRGAWE
jgi:hypothetical protein